VKVVAKAKISNGWRGKWMDGWMDGRDVEESVIRFDVI
jgi:hypothetical protein